jgi:hypothetical protein
VNDIDLTPDGWIMVHSSMPTIGQNTPVKAHAFGVFPTPEAAEAFDRLAPDDCYRWLLPVVIPPNHVLALAIEAAK